MGLENGLHSRDPPLPSNPRPLSPFDCQRGAPEPIQSQACARELQRYTAAAGMSMIIIVYTDTYTIVSSEMNTRIIWAGQ